MNESTGSIIVKAKNDLTVLNRIVTVLRKRRFEIEEFAVNLKSGDELMSVNIIVNADKEHLNQVMAQIDKLIDVYEVNESEG